MSKASNPYGDGTACDKILEALEMAKYTNRKNNYETQDSSQGSREKRI